MNSLLTGVMPDWVCIAFGIGVFIALPLDTWLRAWPAAVKDRDKRTEPRYHHE